MNCWIVGITASATLLVSAPNAARAQAAASWPSTGTHLVRVEDPSVPPTSDIAGSACARQLRDPRTGREYLLRRSSAKTEVASHQENAPSTSTRLLRAVGEYSRVELK